MITNLLSPGHGTQYDSSFERAAVLRRFWGYYMTRPRLVFENEKILVFQQQLGEWDNLNHLIVCRTTNNACIIDPFDGKYWHEFCQSKIIHSPKYGSHIAIGTILKELKSYFKYLRAKCWFDVIFWNKNEDINCKMMLFGGTMKNLLNQPTNRNVESFSIHCTPGHTPGHVTIIGNGIVVTGDCLFLGRCGRTDLFGGDQR